MATYSIKPWRGMQLIDLADDIGYIIEDPNGDLMINRGITDVNDKAFLDILSNYSSSDLKTISGKMNLNYYQGNGTYSFSHS